MAKPSTDPALDDPMFRELRQRHPDVDIVLLPAIAPITDLRPATPARRRDLQRHARAILHQVSSRLNLAPTGVVEHWWSQSQPEMQRWVVSASFSPADEDGIAALRALANVLVELGWEPRPAADGSPRIKGVAGPCEFFATATATRLSVLIQSTPLYVPQERVGEAEAPA